MSWPAYSPDLNILENVWGLLCRDVYADNKQYETVELLRDAVKLAWSRLSQDHINALFNSLSERVFNVIYKQGGHCDV